MALNVDSSFHGAFWWNQNIPNATNSLCKNKIDANKLVVTQQISRTTKRYAYQMPTDKFFYWDRRCYLKVFPFKSHDENALTSLRISGKRRCNNSPGK